MSDLPTITTAANRYAGACAACGEWTAKGAGVYLKRRLVCAACLQWHADETATHLSAKRVIRGPMRAENRSGLPAALLAWAIRENGIMGWDRMIDRHRDPRQRWAIVKPTGERDAAAERRLELDRA